MKWKTKRIFAFCLLTWSTGAVAQQHPDPAILKQAAIANSLTGEGKIPFHLKMSFQLFDLGGKKSEAGTLEEWWVSTGVSRLTVISPSVNFTTPSEGTPPDVVTSRERYLIETLLEEEQMPIPDLSLGPHPADQASRTFGKIQLSCYAAVNINDRVSGAPRINYCVDPESHALRLKFEPGMLNSVHNSIGTFHGTNVAMAIDIAYAGKAAISGKILELQSFDAANSNLVMTHPPQPSTSPAGVKGGVTPGKLDNHVAPVYPAAARSMHVTGTVVLHAAVSQQGKIVDLFPIASPSSLLTGAAIEAVKQWTYTPFLLNGQPVKADTIISVNFGLVGPA